MGLGVSDWNNSIRSCLERKKQKLQILGVLREKPLSLRENKFSNFLSLFYLVIHHLINLEEQISFLSVNSVCIFE